MHVQYALVGMFLPNGKQGMRRNKEYFRESILFGSLCQFIYTANNDYLTLWYTFCQKPIRGCVCNFNKVFAELVRIHLGCCFLFDLVFVYFKCIQHFASEWKCTNLIVFWSELTWQDIDSNKVVQSSKRIKKRCHWHTETD